MPKKLINDYVFYKIICLDNSVDLCYVGSTANWKERQRQHKYKCINENGKWSNTKIYKIIRANGGWSNFKMVQIGTREQLTIREAEQIEEEFRIELKANMNGRRCYITEEETKKYKKEIDKKYREKNKEKIKEYQINNKEKLKEYSKKYIENNKEKKKEYNEKNKEKIAEYSKKYHEKKKEQNENAN
mgnify:FL=1|tara:strand:+ start:1531 stop:2091 length:561 start_codon:yes stop_codon:yes gene_type:complete